MVTPDTLSAWLKGQALPIGIIIVLAGRGPCAS